MKKSSSLLKAMGLFFAVVIAAVIFPVMASAAGKVKVTADVLNVRAEAASSSNKVGSVIKDETYDVIESKTSGSKTWYKISLSDGTVGWVHGDYVKYTADTSTSTSTGTSATEVKACNPVPGSIKGDVRVRSGAGTTFDIVTTAKANTAVTVVGYATGSDKKVWYQVSYKNDGTDISGFVRSDYIKVNGEVTDYVEPEPEPEPEVEPEPEKQPEPEKEPVKVYKDYEAVYSEAEDCWYLNNYREGTKAKITDLFESEQKFKEYKAEMEKKLSKKTGLVVFLLIIIIALLILGALAFIRFRQWYYGGDDETEEPVKTNYRDTKETKDTQAEQPSRNSGVQMQTVGGATTPKASGATVVRGLPKGAIRLPDGRIQMPDGRIAMSGIPQEDGSIKLADGRIRKADGTIINPNESPVSQDTISIATRTGSSSQSVREVPVGGSRPSGEDDDMEFGFLNSTEE